MTTEVTSACPHCSAMNPMGSAFCGTCGKALPQNTPMSPHLVTADQAGYGGAGTKLLSDELTATTRKAATALMWVAILQTVVGPIMLMMQIEQMKRSAPPGMVFQPSPIAWVVILGIAAAFWGLYFWARVNPLPAAIVGLVFFLTLHLVDAVMDPMTLAQGWLVKIIVIVVLSKAISAGLQRKRLLESQGQSA